MSYVVLVTVLVLLQYFFFMMRTAMARVKGDVQAPATNGDEDYERKSRIHLNTLEQLMITIPAMWVCATYVSPIIGAGLGFVFFIGRALYSAGYLRNPNQRTPGMIIGVVANAGLMLTICWYLLMLVLT